MLNFKVKIALFLIMVFISSYSVHSQMIMGAGVLIATIDGKVDTISLNISSHNDPNATYCDAMGGTAEIGMFHFMWEKAGSFTEIKLQTLDLNTAEAPGLVPTRMARAGRGDGPTGSCTRDRL